MKGRLWVGETIESRRTREGVGVWQYFDIYIECANYLHDHVSRQVANGHRFVD